MSVIMLLAACSTSGPNARDEALADARVSIDKVSAVAVESAIGLDLASYSLAVSRGEAWPKPAFSTIQEDSREFLPGWARGASFDVGTDQSGSYPRVVISYAVPGQGAVGSGFHTKVSDVLVCVKIGIEFIDDQVAVRMPPTVAAIPCPEDVQQYFGPDELVTLDEVLATGHGPKQ
ncbi:hypothetical protein [Conyzicola sp.]|uniref:hypothetical protein n=1 Tax=Conyzicola sp. TaxID=1969404 RepID=UPI003989B2B4